MTRIPTARVRQRDPAPSKTSGMPLLLLGIAIGLALGVVIGLIGGMVLTMDEQAGDPMVMALLPPSEATLSPVPQTVQPQPPSSRAEPAPAVGAADHPAVTDSPAPTQPSSPPPASPTANRDESSLALVGQPYVVPAGRSPIPQPGEFFPAPLPYRHRDEDAPQMLDPAQMIAAVVSWDKAHEHVGQLVTVEGRIVDTHNTGRVCFLNFDMERGEGGFYLVLFGPMFSAWPEPPEKYFLNQDIRATGRVEMHRGRPQMRIEHTGQLQRME